LQKIKNAQPTRNIRDYTNYNAVRYFEEYALIYIFQENNVTKEKKIFLSINSLRATLTKPYITDTILLFHLRLFLQKFPTKHECIERREMEEIQEIHLEDLQDDARWLVQIFLRCI